MRMLSSRAAWVRCAPFAVFMAALGLRLFAPELASWAFDPRWLDACGALLAVALVWHFRSEYAELSAKALPGWREAAIAGGAGIAAFTLMISLNAPWMRWTDVTSGYRPVDAEGHLIWSLLAARYLSTALIVPLIDELFWRSFLLRRITARRFETIDPRALGASPVVVSALFFGLVHPMWFSSLLAGLVYGWLYVHGGRLLSALIAHTVTNGMLGVWVVLTGHWGFG